MKFNCSYINEMDLRSKQVSRPDQRHGTKISPALILVTVLLMIFPAGSSAQWVELGSGLDLLPAAVWGISAPDSMTVWATTWNDVEFVPYDRVCRTIDGGQNWEVFEVEPAISPWSASIHALDDQTAWVIFVNLDFPIEGEIYKTSDGGANWTHQSTAFSQENESPTSIHFFDADNGVAFGGADEYMLDHLINVYRTSDGGENWIEIPEGALPDLMIGEGMSNELGNGNHDVIGDHVWFPTSEGRVFHSNDRGDTWTVADAGLTGALPNNVISIAMRDTLHGLLISNEPNEVFRTNDGGMTWEDTEFNNDIIPIYQIDHVPGTEGTYMMIDGWPNNSSVALVTTDEGENWNIVGTDEVVSCVEFLSPSAGFAGGYIFSESEGGIYRWSDADVLLSTGIKGEVDQFEFYPNPAQDFLYIQLKPETRIHRIDIVDMVGRLVSTRTLDLNRSFVSIDIASLAKGSYIVEVHSHRSSSTEQFIKY